MDHYARGDSRRIIFSSDEEEGYRSASQRLSRTSSTMSRINSCDKRNLMFGMFGEAPPVHLPPIADETDRQFWAEDELSSSESRHMINPRRKRRRSVAYRNRAAIHRSQSGHVQSSSSSTEPARLNIPPAVRKRRKHRNSPGTSRSQRPRIASGGNRSKINAKTVSRLVSAGNNLASGCQIVQPNCTQELKLSTSNLSNGVNEEAGIARIRENIPTSRTPSKSDSRNVRRNRISKLRLPSRFRRK